MGHRQLICLALAAIFATTLAARQDVALRRVLDGDTVDVNPVSAPQRKIRVRMRYIDAPEKAQKFGKESTQFLKGILEAKTANQRLQLDVYKTDMYGRTIGELFLGDDNVNKRMVDKGYAWCYQMRCPENYKVGMELAMRDKIGLFAQKNPLKPWDYRKSKRKKSKGKKPSVVKTTDQIIKDIKKIPALGRNAERLEVDLLRVSDGDTITVRPKNSNDKIRVRFLFIDAPEKSQSSGQDSKNFLKQTLEDGARKKLVIRVKETDRYGRTLGVVYLGRRDINKLMVANGYAWCYKTGCPRSYLSAMKKARQASRGLWEESNPQAPWNYRKYGPPAKKG